MASPTLQHRSPATEQHMPFSTANATAKFIPKNCTRRKEPQRWGGFGKNSIHELATPSCLQITIAENTKGHTQRQTGKGKGTHGLSEWAFKLRDKSYSPHTLQVNGLNKDCSNEPSNL